jgi:hypothetical protein
VLLALALIAACRTGRSYASPEGPRYAGSPSAPRASIQRGDTLLVVSFNIEFAQRVDSAIAVLTSDPAVRHADVILLQEMDGPSVKRIADTLGMHYVFYAAILHTRTSRDFGNAVLSRWPIIEDAKLILPHPSRYARTHRTATAATILVRDSLVRVYSTHLGTVADVSASNRRNQLRAILADAERHRYAVIGGDMNDIDVGPVASALGFAWPTERIPGATSSAAGITSSSRALRFQTGVPAPCATTAAPAITAPFGRSRCSASRSREKKTADGVNAPSTVATYAMESISLRRSP